MSTKINNTNHKVVSVSLIQKVMMINPTENKETRNENSVFYGIRSVAKPTDWSNPKNNFTKVTPPTETIEYGVPCDWNGTAWVIDSSENQIFINRKTAIQSFINSPFNNITIEQANEYIDINVTDLNSAKEMMKKIVKFQIGMREILRKQINNQE